MTANRPCRSLALLLLAVGCGWAQTMVPDTPAGHTLQAWLDAFNSGDRAKVENYIKTVDPSQSVDGMPFAKSLDPVTKTNWEGTGVTPDVKVPAADALATAEKLAAEKIQGNKYSK
jgi:hypothetical protein